MQKTRDGRIIEKRISVEKKLIKEIILKIKEEKNLTWKELAQNFKVSEDTIRVSWIRKGSTIPISIFKKIIKLYPNLNIKDIDGIKIKKPYWGQKKGKKSKHENLLKLPNKESLELIEFYGSLLGDGCIYKDLSGICISGDSILDQDYLTRYITNICKRIFNIIPKIYYSKKGKDIRCVIYCKKIAIFLRDIGFPLGKKKQGFLEIPKYFFIDKKKLKRCIRGLFDTDGSIYPHKGAKIILEISITDKNLLKSTQKAFEEVGIEVKKSKNRLYMIGTKKVNKFFREISSSNKKHLLKYNYFKMKGVVPKSKEIERYLKEGLSTNMQEGP
ncbi:hypothetical protein HOC80_01720 [archaeon]|jgi:hypothetical protein|nr:hypothetical protein [archaeon]MBT4416800.1 hypothetical protein [archaeon]